MELTRLRHILAVARTGSFSRAAEEERITQPALSRSIAAFEQRHGVILFDRGRGGAHPTPAGRLVIEQARRLLSATNDLERSLRLYGTGEAGRLAFGLGPLLASLFLPGLGQLRSTHADTRPNSERNRMLSVTIARLTACRAGHIVAVHVEDERLVFPNSTNRRSLWQDYL